MDQYGPSFNSLTHRCLECNAFHTILTCLLIVFLITVFYFIVLMFRLNFRPHAGIHNILSLVFCLLQEQSWTLILSYH